MEVLIFKTNVSSKSQVRKISPLLTTFPSIQQWNFDLDDCDKILRIVATGIKPGSVETLLQTAGFNCRELDY